MALHTVVVGTFFICVVRHTQKSGNLFDLGDALLLVTGMAMLLLQDSMKWRHRVVALENYLCKCPPRTTATIADKARPIPPAELRDCAQQLEEHLAVIIGERHPRTSRRHHDLVRDYVAQQLHELGWAVRLESVKGPHGLGQNVIAERTGRAEVNCKTSPKILIVGAHYDTVTGTPGADDNGIAVAGVLRLARLLQHMELEHTVRLVAWDLEEQQGWGRCLLGSKTMIRNIRKSGESILGVVCLEMIGLCDHRPNTQHFVPGLRWLAPEVYHEVKSRQERADFIAAVGNPASEELMGLYATAAKSRDLPTIQLVNRGFIRLLKDLRRSDHAPFWDAGVPAIMLTDTSNFRSSFYHTAMDRPETIDFEFASKVVMSTADCVRKLAGAIHCPDVLPEKCSVLSST